MNKPFDVVVVGGGCIGSSILHSLMLQGKKHVALVDRHRHTTSATANSGGMMRIFHEDPRHTQLAIQSTLLLKRYRSAGFIKTDLCCNGSLYFFDRRRYEQFEASMALMDDAGCSFEIVTPQSGRKDFPEFRWSDNDLAVYESTGKQIDPLLLNQELLRASEHQGATLFEDQHVHHITRTSHGYELHLEATSIYANQVVLAGGAAMIPLIHKLKISIPLVAKRLTSYLTANRPEYQHLPNYFDRETLEYARFGMGTHMLFSKPLLERLHIPTEVGPFTEQTADDSYAPERQGFIYTPEDYPGLTVVSGWGGTAFKFALEIGRICEASIRQIHPERTVLYAAGTP